MEKNLLINAKLSNDEARNYILMIFDGYMARKRKGTLYRDNDPVPEIIIKTYYSCVDKVNFDEILSTFRKKYITNENKLELVHSRQEQLGMGIVYDYIQNFFNYDNLNIYTLLSIHSLLFSKVPCPEFGGKFRNYDVYLPGTGIPTSTWDSVPMEIQNLFVPVNSLINEGLKLRDDINPNSLMDYINKCIELKCNIIRIHPFADGNGRSTRAFINLLFKIANIPPVYVKETERLEYQKAMQKAIGDENLSDIKTFYYYKICDSIIELDINISRDEKYKLR